jgi:hypothetical protein
MTITHRLSDLVLCITGLPVFSARLHTGVGAPDARCGRILVRAIATFRVWGEL